MLSDRVREVRNALGLSQTEFGARIGVSIDVIKNIEYSRSSPSELLLKHMCEIHHINRTGLETGEGDMFEPTTKADETARMVESVSNSQAMRSLLATWAQLSDENKAAFEAFAADYVEDYNRRRTEQAMSVDQAIVDDAAASIHPQSTPYADQQAQ